MSLASFIIKRKDFIQRSTCVEWGISDKTVILHIWNIGLKESTEKVQCHSNLSNKLAPVLRVIHRDNIGKLDEG